jgi:xanthine/CO dehydrogenase XdhC/CoxF family maturation factor
MTARPYSRSRSNNALSAALLQLEGFRAPSRRRAADEGARRCQTAGMSPTSPHQVTTEAHASAEHTLLVVGEGDVARSLEAMSTALGWNIVMVATLDATLAALPRADSVVVLSHHDGTDGPALAASLAAEKPYVGAMGSRRTQSRRREWMLEHGVDPGLVDSVRGPAGLDIGADTPAEIAVSILAEVIATHRGRSGVASISDRSGPVHPDLPPGTATCPSG